MDKKILIKKLFLELKSLTNAKIHICEHVAPNCMNDVSDVLSDILEKMNVRIKKNVVMNENLIHLTGELDFNEYKAITDKLIENGFKKGNFKIIAEKEYDEYKVGIDLFKVIIPKSIA